MVVTGVDPRSAAARAGLRPGDVLLEVDPQASDDAEAASRRLHQSQGQRASARESPRKHRLRGRSPLGSSGSSPPVSTAGRGVSMWHKSAWDPRGRWALEREGATMTGHGRGAPSNACAAGREGPASSEASLLPGSTPSERPSRARRAAAAIRRDFKVWPHDATPLERAPASEEEDTRIGQQLGGTYETLRRDRRGRHGPRLRGPARAPRRQALRAQAPASGSRPQTGHCGLSFQREA